MPNKGHSDEKIAFALRQVEAGKRVAASTGVFAADLLRLEAKGVGDETAPLAEAAVLSGTGSARRDPRHPSDEGLAGGMRLPTSSPSSRRSCTYGRSCRM